MVSADQPVHPSVSNALNRGGSLDFAWGLSDHRTNLHQRYQTQYTVSPNCFHRIIRHFASLPKAYPQIPHHQSQRKRCYPGYFDRWSRSPGRAALPPRPSCFWGESRRFIGIVGARTGVPRARAHQFSRIRLYMGRRRNRSWPIFVDADHSQEKLEEVLGLCA